MNCPICASELVDAKHEGVTIHSCSAGHGIWLDSGVLLNIVEQEIEPRSDAERDAARNAGGSRNPSDPTPNADRNCPVCREPLERVNYDDWSGVYIDDCMEHGVWLDIGELERLEAWVEANKEELAPVRERIDTALSSAPLPTALRPQLSLLARIALGRDRNYW